MNDAAENAIIRKKLLEQYFHLYEGEPITLSAGDKANNKLDLEPMSQDASMRELVIPALGGMVMKHNPDFVVGVPNGATWLAGAVAVETGCNVANLVKDGDGSIDYEDSYIDREVVSASLRGGVLIEDVTRTLKNVRRALEVPDLSAKITAVVTVWDRNPYSMRRLMPAQPLEALISEHIPEILPDNAALVRHAAEHSA